MEKSYDKEKDCKIYTLYLNSNTGFPNLIPTTTGNNNNVFWNVDWDSLFNRENYIYKNCRVRFRMLGENNNTSTQSTDGPIGILVANFGQNFTGKNAPNVILGIVEQNRSASYLISGSPAVGNWSNTGTYMTAETFTDAYGQQIDVPKGLTQFNLQIWKDGYGVPTDTNYTLIDNNSTVQYFILLQFELFN